MMMLARMLLGTGGKYVIAAALVLSVVSTLWIERNSARREVNEQARALALRQAAIAQLEANVTQLRQTIAHQNTAVDNLKKEGEARHQAAERALLRAQQNGRLYEAQIARLNEKNRAAETMKKWSCDDAIREWRAAR